VSDGQAGELGANPVTVAERLGEVFARHATAARQAGAATEAEARRVALAELMAELHREVAPTLAGALAGMAESMPADHPLRPFVDSLGSPSNPIVAAILTMLGYMGMVVGIVPAMGRILLQPYVNELYSRNVDVPLSVADLANMVVQGIVDQPTGEQLAGLTGYSPANFDAMVRVTGMPPSPQDLFQMFRRGLIAMTPEVEGALSVQLGIEQGHTKDEWIQAFSELAYTWPMPTEFVNAAVREQVDYGTAKAWAGKAGLDTTTEVAPGVTFFDLMFDVAGRPPGPEMAARMAHRGIIPWEGSGPAVTTFRQAIAESDLKTKWTAALEAESRYVPPIAEVKSMYQHGALDREQAVTYLGMNGVDPDLAEAILYLAEQEYVAQDKALAKADIQSMYVSGELDYADALAQLEVIGYRGTVGEWVLELANVKREQRVLNRATTMVTNEVIKGFYSSAVGEATLAGLGVPAEQIKWLSAEWTWQRTLERKQPSVSQIGKAFMYGGITESEAMAYLANLGYPPFDAYIILTAEAEAPPPVKPPMPSMPHPWPPQDAAGNVVYPSTPAGHSQPVPPGGSVPPVPGVISPPPPFGATP